MFTNLRPLGLAAASVYLCFVGLNHAGAAQPYGSPSVSRLGQSNTLAGQSLPLTSNPAQRNGYAIPNIGSTPRVPALPGANGSQMRPWPYPPIGSDPRTWSPYPLYPNRPGSDPRTWSPYPYYPDYWPTPSPWTPYYPDNNWWPYNPYYPYPGAIIR